MVDRVTLNAPSVMNFDKLVSEGNRKNGNNMRNSK